MSSGHNKQPAPADESIKLQRRIAELETILLNDERTQTALQKADENFRSLVGHALVGIYMFQDGILRVVGI